MRRTTIRWVLATAVSFATVHTSAKTLAVPQVNQTQMNWCWAATSQAVLSYTGNAPGQCAIVNYARVQKGWGTDDCCLIGNGICDQPNGFLGSGGVHQVLSNWGTDSEYFGNALSQAKVTKYIDDDSPIFVGWLPKSGGVGHAIVVHGASGSTLTVMDPANGPSSVNYSAVVSNATHNWKLTLVAKPLKITYVVDVTGSMFDDIDAVKATIIGQIDNYAAAGRFVKYTLVTYTDSVNYVGSTVESAIIRGWINGLSANGGGDCPEEGYGALDKAAEEAPDSEIWWMTDADSHGGFLRMLLTRLRLLLAGCTLHSTILGACTEPASVETSQAHSSGASKQEIASSRALINEDVSAITAAELLSQATGGLFFTISPDGLPEATRIITEEMGSDAFVTRRALPAGPFMTEVPVDASVTQLKVTLDIAAGESGTLSVESPNGTLLTDSDAGVEQIVADESRMLLIGAPALTPGTFTITTSSTAPYFLSVSAATAHELNLVGDTSSGVGVPVHVKVAIPTLAVSAAQFGPGNGALAGNSQPAAGTFPFDQDDLVFYTEREDGSGRVEIALYDDGLHDDEGQQDGVFGGNVEFASVGRYRIVAAVAGSSFERATKLLIETGAVSLTASTDRVGAPGETITHSFTVQNLTATSTTFDIGVSSVPGWANTAGVPAQITLATGASSTLDIPVSIPAGAVRGESALLGVTVAAYDDPTINDSASVQTDVWTGPLLQGVSGTPAIRGATLTLIGTGFGPDPGSGNRNTASHRVVLAGASVTDANVTAWSDTAIQITVPPDAVSGLLQIIAASEESNPVVLTVVVDVVTPIISKAASSASVPSGNTLTYTITYGNTGDEPAANVIIRDTLPAGTSFVSATDGGTFAAGQVTWMIGTVPAGTTGQTVSFTVLVTASAGATIINSAYSIEATGAPQVSGPPVATAVTAAMAAVPLLNDSGLLLLTILFATVGVFVIGRRWMTG